ncbi:MAG: von Willebrand factor type A domain-containing protein [Lachnospiraceae bacterium]|nr:von Willebrand factor type A domain-containing protein [Lachnospiraceae bacterium]
MNFKSIISKDYNCKAKYDYYLSLGYSEKVSEILATVTYGDEPLCQFVEQTGSPDIIEKLHEWLSEQKEKDPMQALEKRSGAMDVEDTGIVGERSRNLVGRFFGVGSAPRRAVVSVGSALITEPSVSGAAFKIPEFMCCAQSVGGMGDDESFSFAISQDDLMEELSTDRYEMIEEKGAQDPFAAPTSTFRMTTNTASVGIVLNQIREEREVDRSQVRIEELLNYFRYQEESPAA